MWSLSTGSPLADRYLLIEQLGTGGMSVVWRGFDEVLGRPVAIKVLASPIAADPTFRAVIRREARASARLAHPHITHVYDYGEATMADGNTLPYVVMELLDGQTLGQRLKAGPLPWADAVRICAQVADALAAAHRRGVVHRDIAPANIVLTGTGAKVLDFGISALAGGRGDPEGSTLLGTPAYVAPERLDDAPAAPAADVYSLGALLYETLTGAPPLPARDWSALVQAYRDDVPVAPLEVEGLPDEVTALCERCLSRDPAYRPGAADMARVLRQALEPPPPPADAAPPAGGGSGGESPAVATPDVPTLATALAGTPPEVRASLVLAAAGHFDRPSPPAGTLVESGRQRQTIPIPRGRRLPGRAVVTLAVALATLVVTGLVVLNRPGGRPSHPPVAAPSRSPSAAPLLIPVPTAPPTSARPSPTHTSPGPLTTAAAVSLLMDQVAAGRKSGQIRGDAALDLSNVLANIQATLNGGSTTTIPAQLSQLRQKITARVREGAISAGYGDQLLSTLDRVILT